MSKIIDEQLTSYTKNIVINLHWWRQVEDKVMKETFGQRLSRLRKEKGLTQEEIASKVTISPQAVSKWENDISSPDILTLGQLADLLGVSVDELLGREEGSSEPKAERVKTDVVDDDAKFEEKKDDSVRIDDSGIHIESKDGESVHVSKKGVYVNGKSIKEARKVYRKKEALSDLFASLAFFAGLLTFILVGFLWKDHNLGWAAGWTFILFGIALSSLVKAIAKRRFCAFAYPVFITGVYCLLGFLGNAYGFPGFGFYWFLFITIPVYYIIGHYLDRLTGHEDEDDDDDDDDEKDD